MTKRARPAAIPAPLHDRADEDDYFRILQSRMPEESERVIETLRRVRSVYVTSDRNTALKAGFKAFMQRYHSGRGEVREEADIYFLVGKSGAGKSAAMRHLLSEDPSLQPVDTPHGRYTPYVSIKLKGYGLPRLVAARIVRAAGYGQINGDGQAEMWDGLNDALRTQRVFVVHIDEAQHLLKDKATSQQRQDLANAIKGASVDIDWPIAFVFSGLPDVMNLPRDDGQVSRRGDYTVFNDVQMPDEADLVKDIVEKMAKAAKLDVEQLVKGDFLGRLAHAADYRYGRICQLTLSAIQEALNRGKTVLHVRHYARAYERRTLAMGRPDMNPFVTDAWESLLAGSFLQLPEDRGEGPEADDGQG